MAESIVMPNSKLKLQERFQAGRISWTWPVIMVFARLILAVLIQALVAGLYRLQGNPTPWQAAGSWWIVYGTLIDLGCLVLLAWLARREGIRLFDLISFQRQYLRRDLLLGVGFFVLFAILIVPAVIISALLIYGATLGPASMVPLPPWGALYALLVWPIIWAIAEQMTYQGYALPRLEVLSGRAWLAVIIVGFGWALQYSALPLMSDWRWAVFRFVSNIGIVILLIFYLRIRRLLPFIIAHWAMNFLSVLAAVALPLTVS